MMDPRLTLSRGEQRGTAKRIQPFVGGGGERPRQRIVIRERLLNCHILALCVYQLLEAEIAGEGETVCV